jgi:hypothetical protein
MVQLVVRRLGTAGTLVDLAIDLPLGPGGRVVDLIEQLVWHQHAEAVARAERSAGVLPLSSSEIEEGFVTGKVISGTPEVVVGPGVEAAVEAALDGFERGHVEVFVDDVRQQRLNQTITAVDGTTVTIVGMVGISGGG